MRDMMYEINVTLLPPLRNRMCVIHAIFHTMRLLVRL